jgi:toxin ParE1/3/4
MPPRLAPQAGADIDEAWHYVASNGNIEAADRLVDLLTDRFLALARFPQLGRSREDEFGPGHRSLVAGDYVIVYLLDGTSVNILRIVHGKRDFDLIFPR